MKAIEFVARERHKFRLSVVLEVTPVPRQVEVACLENVEPHATSEVDSERRI